MGGWVCGCGYVGCVGVWGVWVCVGVWVFKCSHLAKNEKVYSVHVPTIKTYSVEADGLNKFPVIFFFEK